MFNGRSSLQKTFVAINQLLRYQSTIPVASVGNAKIGAASEHVFKREDKYGAHNYHPMPVAIKDAKGNYSLISRNVKEIRDTLLTFIFGTHSSTP